MENAAPYQECSALLSDAAALRAAARERGYLFFRARLPAAAVREVRRDVLQEIQRQGYLAPDTAWDDAVARPGTSLTAFDANPAYRAYYNGLLRLRSLHALALHPRLLEVLELLFEEPPLTHPRHICHTIFPNDPKYVRVPHQDFFAIRGTTDTWTAWLPLGDCGGELGGGLGIVPGSHASGLQDADDWTMEVKPASDAGWAWSPMSCGDVLLFHSLTIHHAQPNASDRVRLAVSYRHQPCSQPVAASSLQPHMGWLQWDELYRDWAADDPLRYYWRAQQPRVAR